MSHSFPMIHWDRMDIRIFVYDIANGTDWDMSHSFPVVHWDGMDIGIFV